MNNERTLLFLQALALKEQKEQVILCEADSTDTYAGDCIFMKLEDPYFGIHGKLHGRYEYPQFKNKTDFCRQYPFYVCYGCRTMLSEHE